MQMAGCKVTFMLSFLCSSWTGLKCLSITAYVTEEQWSSVQLLKTFIQECESKCSKAVSLFIPRTKRSFHTKPMRRSVRSLKLHAKSGDTNVVLQRKEIKWVAG
jgi:hypothetical protein